MSNFNEEVMSQMDDSARQFLLLLDIPDELFDIAYPNLKEELEKTFKSGEFQKSFEKAISDGKTTIDEAKKSFKELREIFETKDARDSLSANKINFMLNICDRATEMLDGISYREQVEVYLELAHPDAKEPTYANQTDAGADVYAVENVTIGPGETKIIRTGLKMAIPNGWMVSVRPRSGMSVKTKIRVANAPGTVDTGYRNEIGIIMDNIGDSNYDIAVGDRIAQLVIEPAPMMKFIITSDVAAIGEDRGGGFGHTGN